MLKGKSLGAVAGAIATVCVGISSWAYNISNSVAVNSNSISRLEKSINTITEQYQKYDAQLATLIYRQDLRITLLEQLVDDKLIKESEVKNGN